MRASEIPMIAHCKPRNIVSSAKTIGMRWAAPGGAQTEGVHERQQPQSPVNMAGAQRARQRVERRLLHRAVLPRQALDQVQRLVQAPRLRAHLYQQVVARVRWQDALPGTPVLL